jgi:hypothetical protein
MADVTDPVRIDGLLAEHRPVDDPPRGRAQARADDGGQPRRGDQEQRRRAPARWSTLAVEHGVERFVLISTDKAVNPTSVMGATKRLAERYVQHVAARPAALRLGALRQRARLHRQRRADLRGADRRGGPVTVTHPEMRRYFMTIPEASQLVLQAACLGHSGEILVLDMGEPVRIVDLAEAMIRLSGHEPYVDIPIEFTGCGPARSSSRSSRCPRRAPSAPGTRRSGSAATTPPTGTPPSATSRSWSATRTGPRARRRRCAHLIASFVPEFQHGDTAEFHPPGWGSRSSGPRPGA